MTTHVKAETVIHVHFEYPPIPYRGEDYQAYFDDYDGAPDAGHQTHGSGYTVLGALIDFYEDWDAWFDEPLCAHRPCVREDLSDDNDDLIEQLIPGM